MKCPECDGELQVIESWWGRFRVHVAAQLLWCPDCESDWLWRRSDQEMIRRLWAWRRVGGE